MPTSTAMFTDARILALSDAEMRAYIMPMLMSAREYYVAYDYETTVNASGEYPIPRRAIGAKLLNAALIDSTSKLDLVWLTEDELQRTDESPRGIPGLYLKRNIAILVPPTQHGFGSIRLTYNIRPGKLVPVTECRQITAIDTGTKTMTVASTIPSSWSTADTFDLIQDQPHFDVLAIDQVVTVASGTTVTFSDSLPSRLEVGDWISLANESPIIQCPVEIQPLYEQKVATSIARSKGDAEFYKIQKDELDSMEKVIKPVYIPRIEKEGKKINQRSRLLRRL